ncbi:MAG: hypothetical protein SGJ00_11290 [bacterium]|nr:hypothetical protein [bacterium]
MLPKLNYLILTLSLIAVACTTPDIVMVKQDMSHHIDQSKAHQYLFFVQSNNQINSRIAMDECVRLSKSPSKQGYLYTVGEPINTGNREFWHTRMKNDGYDYVVVMRMVDSLIVNTSVNGEGSLNNRSFYGDYSTQIEPYAYNPGYERENNLFYIETNVYYLETDKLVWTCQSKGHNPSNVNDAVKQSAKAAIQKMQRSGFMK